MCGNDSGVDPKIGEGPFDLDLVCRICDNDSIDVEMLKLLGSEDTMPRDSKVPTPLGRIGINDASNSAFDVDRIQEPEALRSGPPNNTFLEADSVKTVAPFLDQLR